MNELYVIGNGFDIHHGLNTSYKDFSNYLIKMNPTLYGTIEKFLHYEVKNKDSNVWNEFEYNLRNIDEDGICEDCNCFLKDYGADDWSDSYHHDYQQCIYDITNNLTRDLLEEFTKWIEIRNATLLNKVQKMKIHTEALFITFNYTMTLEEVYGIDMDRILHIHNSIKDEYDLVLGHNYSNEERNTDLNKPPVIKSISDIDEILAERGLEEDDIRYREGKNIIQSYYDENYKNSRKIIQKNKFFFEEVKDVKKIYVLGHSAAEVDMVYYYELVKYIDDEVLWTFTWYNEDDKMNIENLVKECGIEKYLLCQLCDMNIN